MQQMPLKQKVAFVLPFLQQGGYVADPPPCDTAPYLSQIVEAAGDRIKVAGDILDYDDFYTADAELTFDEKTLDKRLPQSGRSPARYLTEFRERLATVEPLMQPRSSRPAQIVRRRKEQSRSATSSTRSAWRSQAKESASACSKRSRFSAANDVWPASTGRWQLSIQNSTVRRS